jgi:hypothetical protein
MLLPRPLAIRFPRLRGALWSPLVDIALKLNVVVVCAVFLFVGAILIGALKVESPTKQASGIILKMVPAGD